MHQNFKKIFEGKVFRKLIKINQNNQLKYKTLVLNNTWLSDIIPSYKEVRKNSIFLSTYLILKSLIKILFFEYNLYKISEGKDKLWIIVPPSLRISHKDLLYSELKSATKPSLISWRKKFKIKSRREIFIQLEIYLKSLKKIKLINPYSNIYDIGFKSLISIDLYNSLSKQYPKAIFTYKDFQRHENAVVQKANTLGIKTFTTQHSVHPYFKNKNERLGNLVFLNCESKNILLWGKFCKSSYSKHNKNKNFIIFQNLAKPKSLKIRLNKKAILICLGSNRHIYENKAIINLLKKYRIFLVNYKIIIKLHPAMSETYFKRLYFKDLLNFNLKVINSKSDPRYIKNENLIAITGLSGSYYDCIFLGIKTLFYDYKFSLLKKLPRATFNLHKNSDLKKSLIKLEKMNYFDWKKNANKVLINTWGNKIKNSSYLNISEKISKIEKW